MPPRQINECFAVTPQIDPEDLSALAQAGFTTVIANRPDAEVDPPHRSAAMAGHAAQAGLDYHYLPIVPGQLGPEQIEKFSEILDNAPGPVLAYCRSGTRSITAWALGQAGKKPVGEIIEAAQQAGYDLSHLAPLLRG
ncbi:MULTISPECIES: TIGR01244 family sulfur transferase [unclassified Paracoccus (in: a-proteobacteria)]|uniref:TIGR01244 family sulfur transferase n=1 Tax=unclassified Paracoccus (in: a-proteobacteria) TaxID=2688777 RepID=UPI001601849E|nr:MULTISPECIES: TIGR01244 family sulfur transferase [unclassified Paracoccus (in: a-proteobacteria)]MBB1492245.1 TIGR01244 family phosphatase [Paracoccus sp. MC1854]MBB1498673.1 TIGR01244 family phosphatase [Paracoccus sp. MC1862]QQO45639.1 TIGR01244 family phosphatase [Paracoccus sp. MC1862]